MENRLLDFFLNRPSWAPIRFLAKFSGLLKLIQLDITAQELFGQKYAEKLIANSSALPLPPEIANDPDFQKGLQQSIDAKVSATVKTELEKILKQKGLL